MNELKQKYFVSKEAVENYDKHGILQLFLLGFTEMQIAKKDRSFSGLRKSSENKLCTKIQKTVWEIRRKT